MNGVKGGSRLNHGWGERKAEGGLRATAAGDARVFQP